MAGHQQDASSHEDTEKGEALTMGYGIPNDSLPAWKSPNLQQGQLQCKNWARMLRIPPF